ncbi:MAG: hypothetical protein ACK41C_12370 [Phenylobacterium sp.]|jgi:hypothetical protein|uniref:hypothetical protein n=1 Tax=Phenylobacterium sp. TaxID=1871053 RepID=UPI0039193CF1
MSTLSILAALAAATAASAPCAEVHSVPCRGPHSPPPFETVDAVMHNTGVGLNGVIRTGWDNGPAATGLITDLWAAGRCDTPVGANGVIRTGWDNGVERVGLVLSVQPLEAIER